MKRTTSTLAAIGLALSGTVALAGADLPQGGRVERQPADHPGAGPGSRPESGGRDWRGGGTRGERRQERRDDRRDDRRGDRRDERRDNRRDGRAEDRNWGDRGWEGRGWDARGRDGREPRPAVPPRDPRAWRDHDTRRHDREPPRSNWSTRPYDRDARHYGWRDDRGRDWRHRREWYDQYRAARWRYDRGRWYARERFTVGVYFLPRGYSVRLWQRGQWLPSVYYVERRWHLGDYWRYGLYDPPFAAGWVRVGDDALLVDLRSGEVLDVVCELFW